MRASQRGYVCGNLVMIYEIREVGWVLRAQNPMPGRNGHSRRMLWHGGIGWS